MSTSIAEQRAARARQLAMLLIAGVAAVILLLRWVVRRTWRRLLPCYWIAAELALVWVSGPLGIPTGTVALAVIVALVAAAVWPAPSLPVRAWRAGIVAVLGAFAVGTVAAGGPAALAAHPTLLIFGPTLAGVVLGWPWWHHLRRPAPAPAVEAELVVPVIDEQTTHWTHRWEYEVVAEGVCVGTRVLQATTPREGVTELTLKISAGQNMKPAAIMKKGPEVETALELDEGAVGFQSTGKASKIRCTIAERSYIAAGVPWTGPTYRGGRCQILTYVDGSAGAWTFNPPGFGVKCGLVVGSSGAGKSRALGLLIINLLTGGWMVAVGDSQNGQSLPAWKNKTEYHAGPEAVTLLGRRVHAEIMHRSKILADAGVETFDENDPRVIALGLKKLAVIIDECQLVLLRGTPIVALMEQAAETARKTGVSLTLATQLPQMGSLGGSIRLRDALVAGNCLVLRLSNRGSGTSILPDDFVGDPFNIKPEDDEGRPTAGMGYLRNSNKVGMIGRVAKLDETAAAAAAPTIEVVWTVPPIDPATPIVAPKNTTTTTAAGEAGTEGGAVGRLRNLLLGGGAARKAQPVEPVTPVEWVLACLRRGPATAQTLLDRPDCPVKQSQLYTILKTLTDRTVIVRADNGVLTLADPVTTAISR